MRAQTLLALTAAAAAWVMSGPSARAAIYTGGPGAGYAMGAPTNDVYLGAGITLSSAADQFLARGYAPVAISPITITDATNTPVISNGTSLAVWIPAGFAMTWDETELTATVGGTASNKVNTTVSYTNSNQRLVIAVTNNFSAGDTLTIGALAFKNYLDSGSARLELDYDNDGVADAQDAKTITILFYSYGGLGDSCALDQTRIAKSLHPAVGTFFSIR